MTSTTWLAILEELDGVNPLIRTTLNPPATDDQIKALEQRVGTPLPQAFIDYLTTFNGQEIDDLLDNPICGERHLLPVDQIISSMDMMTSLFDPDDVAAGVENKIRGLIWAPRWVPFASFQQEDTLVLDLDPGKNGTLGQVFNYYPGYDWESDDAIVSGSFAEFSDSLLDHLRQHRFTFDDGVLDFENYWI